MTGPLPSRMGVASLVLVACASTPEPKPIKLVVRISTLTAQGDTFPRPGCNEAGICRVFALEGNCPNWEAALAIAKRKAGCGGQGNDDPKAVACRKDFACDICFFLENPAWPVAKISAVPGGKFPYFGAGHAEGLSHIDLFTYAPGTLQGAWVEFRQARCFGPGLGIWPFWEDNIEFLAKALIHESLHLCKIIGGYGPSTVDPTVDRFVNACF